jgi:hypothetical protein
VAPTPAQRSGFKIGDLVVADDYAHDPQPWIPNVAKVIRVHDSGVKIQYFDGKRYFLNYSSIKHIVPTITIDEVFALLKHEALERPETSHAEVRERILTRLVRSNVKPASNTQ